MKSWSDSLMDGYAANGSFHEEVREPSDLKRRLMKFPDLLDVLSAERKIDEALSRLDEGEQIAAEAKETGVLRPAVLSSLQSAITERRQKLVDQLAEAACQPSTRGAELHSLLFSAHYQRYQYNMQCLRPSSTSFVGAYTAPFSWYFQPFVEQQ